MKKSLLIVGLLAVALTACKFGEPPAEDKKRMAEIAAQKEGKSPEEVKAAGEAALAAAKGEVKEVKEEAKEEVKEVKAEAKEEVKEAKADAKEAVAEAKAEAKEEVKEAKEAAK